ncbi:uncharacterized protein LOC142326990 isoform X2 [Lycorma delicatula]|uniref:uncharacterized protein LOC142326990 isoform X2 n=1 Tax=Lycorma delicatula TaxID=130591 RepID=UPI003F51A255
MNTPEKCGHNIYLLNILYSHLFMFTEDLNCYRKRNRLSQKVIKTCNINVNIMVGENKKECKINGKDICRSELNDIKEESENSSPEQENGILNKKRNIKDGVSFSNSCSKSSAHDDDDNDSKNITENKKEEILKKQKENRYLKGILKTKRSKPVKQNIIKTEETLPNPAPRYFGIRSYINSFYYPPDSEVLNSGEYIQDDFEFVVEPGKRRWRNCWFKVGLWGGINLLLLGIIALLVGHLTPPRETVVARVDNLEILDRSAMTFNSRLHLCRLAGITIFCIGGIVLMLTLLISSYQQDTTYYVMNTALVPDIFTRTQGPNQKIWVSRIPLSGTLKPVQPR